MPQITPDTGVSGVGVYAGLACSALAPAPADDAVAVIQRGACAFTTKAQNAEAAACEAAVVFNHFSGYEASVSMIVTAGIPRSGYPLDPRIVSTV